MKKINLILLIGLIAITANSQNLIGAWENIHVNEDGNKIKSVIIFSDGFQVATWYNTETNEFIYCNGGTWKRDGNSITELVEFDSKKSERVGTESVFNIEISETTFKMEGVDKVWNRLDDGTPGKLVGAWLMSGRKRNGELQLRKANQPRKTLKILSGTRFQWIAYNTETRQFIATGGGSYTTIDSKYTENIEFFSKDETRVGAKLSFDFSLLENEWHHAGFSSKGDPLYEVWSTREKQ